MKRIIAILILGFCSCSALMAQKSDISMPKQREELISRANGLLENRGGPVTLPDQLVNPFAAQEEIKPEEEEAPNVAIVQALEESELLARLAAQIPVSGTANLGGEPLLLLGQKRLKAGDLVRISFEGKPYELLIVNVGTTSFTVKKGELTHTRPTRLSR